MQLAGADVEVGGCDGDGEVEGYALRGDGARVGGFGDAADRAGAEEVGGLDEVVGVPLEKG